MDSFENRVNKAFGSLGMSSSWRLSDEQPRLKSRRSQEREEEEEEDAEVEAEEEVEEESRGRRCDGMDFEGDVEEEGRQMRCMVGLDATLDFEEEEDEFDKAAFGLEGNQERLYMMGIKEVDKSCNTSFSLPLSLYDLKKVRRDPRANHSAARARLEEDAMGVPAAAAQKDSMGVLPAGADEAAIGAVAAEEVAMGVPPPPPAEEAAIGAAAVANSSRDAHIVAADVDELMESGSEPRIGDQPSPSKSVSEKPKPVKRVRFALDPEEERAHQEKKTHTVSVRPRGSSEHASKVPDHVRNPSKYTHYTLDWSVEDNDMSNLEAFKACHENLRSSPKEEVSSLQEMTQKIRYIQRPGKATGNAQKSNMEQNNSSVVSVKGVMCIEHCDTETENHAISSDDFMDSKMEDPAHTIADNKLGKPFKNYRVKREAPDSPDI